MDLNLRLLFLFAGVAIAMLVTFTVIFLLQRNKLVYWRKYALKQEEEEKKRSKFLREAEPFTRFFNFVPDSRPEKIAAQQLYVDLVLACYAQTFERLCAKQAALQPKMDPARQATVAELEKDRSDYYELTRELARAKDIFWYCHARAIEMGFFKGLEKHTDYLPISSALARHGITI